MTKNNAMRLGSVLVVLALLTMCAVGGTFAKYTSSAASTDTARVAKWGLTVSAPNPATTFATQYVTSANDSTVTVKSLGTDKVVAPGTSGTAGACTIAGKSEVAVKVGLAGSLTLGDNSKWLISYSDYAGTAHTNEFYFPIKFKVGGTAVDLSNCSSVTDVQTAVNNAIKNATAKTFAVNFDFDDSSNAATIAEIPTVTWEWDYDATSSDADAEAAAIYNQDVKDTQLQANQPSITLEVDTTVTQID